MKRLQPVLSLVAVLISVRLLWPMLTSVHLEGFTAQIQSLALIFAERGSIAGHDIARPLLSQFIFTTRAGVVDILAAGGRFAGNAAFRWLTALSLMALLSASAAVAKQQARVPFFVAVFACILTPGLTEIGFYFNDNVVSAAFAALSIAAAGIASATFGSALAGLLFGMAVSCRIDAVFVAPLLFLVFVLRPQGLGVCIARLVLMGVAALAVGFLSAHINGVTIIDAVRIAKIFTPDRSILGWSPGKRPLIYFFGLASVLLVGLGAKSLWRTRPSGLKGVAWALAFYAYPLALIVYAVRNATEIRYFYPLLAPLIAMHAGSGLLALRTAFHGAPTQGRRWASVMTGAIVMSLLLPPELPLMRDGPRFLTGRLWSVRIWQRWQALVGQSMEHAVSLVDDASKLSAATIVTTHWNDEFYLRLRLFEHGYREVPAGKSCEPLSKYVAGTRVIWHVRMHAQYSLPPFAKQVAEAVPLLGADRCSGVWHTEAIWVTTFGPIRPEGAEIGLSDQDFEPPLEDLLWRSSRDKAGLMGPTELTYGIMSAVRVTPERLRILSAKAATFADVDRRRAGISSDAMMEMYNDAFRLR